MTLIRLGQESFCCRPQNRVTTPIPLSHLLQSILLLSHHNSCAPFSLWCFDCSSFFIAPPFALWGPAICTVTGVLPMWVMGLLPVALPAATASRGNSHLCRSATWPLSYTASFLSFFSPLASSSLLLFCCNLRERSNGSTGVSGSSIRRELSCMFVCFSSCYEVCVCVCVCVCHAGFQLINPCTLRVWVYLCTYPCV